MLGEKFSHSNMRRGNKLLILKLIREMGPISRADISRITGLTKSTVSDIVNALLEKKILRIVGVEKKEGAGRKGILLDINSSEFLIVGYDVGTLYSRVILTDLDGNVIRSMKFETEHGMKLIDQVRNAIEEIGSGFRDRIVGIGFGVPGMVDYKTGNIDHSPNLGLRNFPFKDILEELLHCKNLVIDHNVKLMLKAEMEYGSAKGKDDVLLLNLGPGIGSAFVSDGKLVRGSHNFSGEIGHIAVVSDGENCSCGKIGCLETVSSAWGIVRMYEKFSGEKLKHPFDAEYVAEKALEGDTIAQKVFERAGFYLGKIVAQTVNIVDPELVLIAGGLSRAWKLMENSFKKSFEDNLLVVLRNKVSVILSNLGDTSTALGAATMAVEIFFERICS